MLAKSVRCGVGVFLWCVYVSEAPLHCTCRRNSGMAYWQSQVGVTCMNVCVCKGFPCIACVKETVQLPRVPHWLITA
jgi:hypothetical protein